MYRRSPTLIAMACAIPLALAGCGTEESPSPGEQPPAATTPADTAPETTEPEDADETTEEDDVTTEEPTDEGDGAETSDPGQGARPGQVPEEIVQREEVQAAIVDASERDDVSPEDVIVISYTDVTWRDGSIGCPEPGMMYTQALVPGYELILEVNGQELSYHAAEGDDFFFCADPQEPAPGAGATETS